MEEHWASFSEHVGDLRQTVVRSLAIISIGFIAVLAFYHPILHFLIDLSLERTESGLSKNRVERIQVFNQTTIDQPFELPVHAWLISNQTSHFRKESPSLYWIAPEKSLIYEEAIHSPLLIMGPLEGLVLVFKACFWISIALTAPFWGWIWLRFILPGMKIQERSMLFSFILYSLLAGIIGMMVAYFITLPLSSQYLTLFNASLGQNAWTLTHYVNYILLLCMGHVVAAELSFILFLLVHYQLLSPEWLIAKRPYMIVTAFILGALLTPPDILTQLLLAIPLIGLYEIAIWYGKWRQHLSFTKIIEK